MHSLDAAQVERCVDFADLAMVQRDNIVQIAYCTNCGKHTGHKRVVGVIGAVTALATVGANLLAYNKRCVICGLTVEEANALKPVSKVKATMTAPTRGWWNR